MTAEGTRRRRTPAQDRSRDTVDAICAAAEEILAEQGIVALNTNAVARRAGVSITAVYAYFPDKWAVMEELLDRFERMRTDYLEVAFTDLRAAPDWREALRTAWRALVVFRVEVPAGLALRKAVHATPRLAEIEAAQSARAARDFARVIRARRPDVDADEAFRVAWAATIAAGTILDDVCASGAIDEARLATGTRLMLTWLAPYMDPA